MFNLEQTLACVTSSRVLTPAALFLPQHTGFSLGQLLQTNAVCTFSGELPPSAPSRRAQPAHLPLPQHSSSLELVEGPRPTQGQPCCCWEWHPAGQSCLLWVQSQPCQPRWALPRHPLLSSNGNRQKRPISDGTAQGQHSDTRHWA